MGTTPIFGFPYPDPSDLVANYPALGQQLAEDVEDEIIASGGLSLITGNTFSAVSSVSVDNCFTSTYANYVIYFKATASSGTPVLRLRLRVGGVDNSTAASYARQEAFFNNTTISGSRATDDLAFLGEIATVESNLIVNIFSPQLTTITSYRSVTQSGRLSAGIYDVAGTHNQTVAYDGFTATPASGTMTGGFRVYGVKN